MRRGKEKRYETTDNRRECNDQILVTPMAKSPLSVKMWHLRLVTRLHGCLLHGVSFTIDNFRSAT
jgi:hypothetical protein